MGLDVVTAAPGGASSGRAIDVTPGSRGGRMPARKPSAVPAPKLWVEIGESSSLEPNFMSCFP